MIRLQIFAIIHSHKNITFENMEVNQDVRKKKICH